MIADARIAVLLAVVTFPILILTQLVLVRTAKLQRPTWQLAALYVGVAAYLAGWGWGWTRLSRSASLEGFLAGCSSATFLILGYFQVYALLDRGITLQCVVDLYRSGRPMSRDELQRAYNGHRGLAWMLDKRIRHMRLVGVIAVEDEHIRLKPPLGPFFGWLGLATKRFLKLGAGG